MALIQPLDKTLDIIIAINSGNESEAASQLGMTCSGSAEGDSFLAKVVAVAGNANSYHNGGVLVTPDTKSITCKELTSDALELSYALTESVSMIVANSITAIQSISEDTTLPDETSDDGNNNAPLNSDMMNNIKDNMKDGLITIKDALVDVFANTAKLNLKATEMFKKALMDGGSSKELYVSLVGNAVTASGMLYGINKINEYKNNNSGNLSEAMNTTNVIHRADDILFSTLNLQENLIDLYTNLNSLNIKAAALIESVEMPSTDSGDPLANASEFISVAIEKVAKPLASASLSNELGATFEKAVIAIASLYDEYLQDYCGNSSSTADTTTEEQPAAEEVI